MYGQSHWFNGVGLVRSHTTHRNSTGNIETNNNQFQDLFEGIEPHLHEETSNPISGIQRCKSQAKVIKSQCAPPWPFHTQTDLLPKGIADELVDCYFRTTETIYRVLHIPSFKKDYDTLWLSETEPNPGFLVQIKLVLAIGAEL